MVFDNYTEGISVKEITHERRGGRLRKSDPINLEDSTQADQGQDRVYCKDVTKTHQKKRKNSMLQFLYDCRFLCNSFSK